MKNKMIECKKCINNSNNPSISFDKQGFCNICSFFKKNFDPKILDQELSLLKSLISKSDKCDAMVGISGGKDSTVTLYLAKELGFKPLAFTFDTGYYPQHEFTRAKEVANLIGVPYERINIQKYIRPIDRKCYKLMADLYDEPESKSLSEKFKKLYGEGRKHYSVSCKHILPFVRTCQLCRKVVIRAYYGEVMKRGINVLILGVNEWASLSAATSGKKAKISAIRKIKPFKNKPALYIVHLPFLLERSLEDNRKILKKLGWQKPVGEDLIESNSNSCLLGLAAEAKAYRMLGFHPDSTRLAREVTVGFLTKKEAKKALSKIHKYKYSVREVLKQARILK